MKKLPMIIPLVFLLCLLLAAVSVNTLADEKKERERFSGNVIGMPGSEAEVSRKLNMIVDRWSTPEEVKQIYNLIKGDDIKAVRKAVRKKNVGYIWFTTRRRFPITFAFATDTEKGRLIRLIIEHPILPGETQKLQPTGFFEQFGAVEFTLSKSDEGEGYVYGRVTISINEDGTIGFKPLTSIKPMLKKVRKN